MSASTHAAAHLRACPHSHTPSGGAPAPRPAPPGLPLAAPLLTAPLFPAARAERADSLTAKINAELVEPEEHAGGAAGAGGRGH